MKWRPSWQLVQDMAILGTGLAIVWSQLILWAVRDRVPSDVLLAVGLGLLSGGAIPHVKTVLGAPHGTAGSSSPSSPPPLPPSSSPSSRQGEASGSGS